MDSSEPLPHVESWPDAERIFRADRRWRGADNGYTVSLGGDRTLWLFADSFVADPPAARRNARELWGNTIAIMDGLDPLTASMRYYWRSSGEGRTAFFPARDDVAHADRLAIDGSTGDHSRLVMWPGHGIRLDAGVLLFFQVVDFRLPEGEWTQPTSFTFVGWAARLITNPDDEPSAWRTRDLAAPQNPYGINVGSAQVLRKDDHVYAYSADPSEPIDAYLARWPIRQVERADLADPQWWCGPDRGWTRQSRIDGRPTVVLPDAKSEFTVHKDMRSGGYVQVQGSDYFSARMLWRRSPALEGPWSAPSIVYEPPELGRDGIAMYAFKVHPHLSGADLVATYVTLPANRDLLLDEEQYYYPRMLRLTLPDGQKETSRRVISSGGPR